MSLIWFAALAHPAAAQESVLYNFGITSTDAKSPESELIFDKQGNLYGTSNSGGQAGYGTVFELSPGAGGVWTETILYSFGGELANDAGGPSSALIFDSQGNLYGTTFSGGQYGYGAVFELTPHTGGAWTETVLHSFNYSTAEGSSPVGSLLIDGSGNLYGAASAGGKHFNGAIYELSPASGGVWNQTILYNFGTSPDAAGPDGGLVFDKSGNIFGSTYGGGTTNAGAIYELSPAGAGVWTEQVLHSFPINSPTDGWEPNSTLIFDAAGNLYGTTNTGGQSFGTVFELSPQSGGVWTEKLIYTFDPTDANPDGNKPRGNLAFDSKGRLYGLTYFSQGGGFTGSGLLYQLTPQSDGTWTRLILHDFTGDYTPEDVAMDGIFPDAGVVFDASGNLYGTTQGGGVNAYGVFYTLGTEPAVAAPVFSPVEGTYSSPQTITITDSTPGSTIYYSNNGTPDTTSTVYSGPFTVSTSQSIVAFATAPGYMDSSYPLARYNITPQAATPVFSPVAGTYTSPQSVTISDSTNGATLYYTTNGTTPTTSSTKYTAAISVTSTETLEAIAVASGDANSAVASATYTIQEPAAATPVFSPAIGTYTTAQSVTITDSTNGATIYYTTDGTTPTTASTKYTGAIPVSATETIEAIAAATGYANSAVATATYTITPPAATPAFSPAAGTYTSAQSVTITDSTNGSTIYFTTDGTTPTAASTKYTGAIPVSATETIKAIATATGYSSSATASATYTINLPAAATPVFTPVGGSYDSIQTVTIGDTTNGAAIYYTTDGSTPTASSTKYTGSITVSQTETIQAIAIASGYANSAIASAKFTITVAVGNSQINILTSFNSEGECPGFGLPSAPIFDSKGNLFGTCNGITGGGEVYEVSPVSGGGWTQTVIYNNGLNLGNPNPGLTFDASKTNLYGTENSGGTVGAGSVYELSPASGGGWTITTLYSFQTGTKDGQAPAAGLVRDAAGNLYGTTDLGGANNDGTVFELTPVSGGGWTEKILYNFGASSADGINPKSSLIFDTKGNLYGSTYGGGGTGSFGTIFELSPATGGTWTEQVIQSMSVSGTPYGQHPVGDLVLDAAGNLYAVTSSSGKVLEFSPGTGGTWTTSVLHSFGSVAGDGSTPTAGLSIDSKGNLYGTTSSGGANGFAGTIYEIVPSDGTWTEDLLYSFNQTDDIGYAPATTLTRDASGNLYGVTTQGGIGGGGTLFEFLATPLAATPTFSPAAGTYTSTQSVTISDTTAGATIYYTTDGTTPTASSTKYTGAISVTATETIQAIAVATGYANSGVASDTYTITLPVAATPTFSPAAGTYISTQSVTISDATSGATIYYTTDGTTPTTTSTKYSGAISVSANETIEAIATATGYTQSAVASATYTITPPAATPAFSPAAGTYTSVQSVTLTDSTSGSTIFYTTDGTMPTTASTRYTGAITVSATETIKAIATATGYSTSALASATYTINLPAAATPTFSPIAGTYTSIQSVTISDATSGSTIYFTTDGTTPTTASTKYTSAISVSATETIKAIASATGYTSSAVASATYTINLPAAATPTFSPAAGTYTSTQSVTISDATGGSTVYYTTDGTTPTTASTKYTGAIAVSSTETIKAIATATGYSSSAVASATYTITPPAAAPVFSVTAGTYTSVQSVTISDSTMGAVIYYTTNGTAPTTASTKYTGAITVSSTETLEAIATATGYSESPVTTAAYTITLPAATPAFSIAAGTYTTVQTVSITDSTAGSTIYYTTDGTTPTTSSTQYNGALTVSATETVEAIATATGYSTSAVASATYTINLPVPGFSLTVSPSSLTIPAGKSGTATITVSPTNGFAATTTFNCTGLPAGATCSFAPSSVQPSGAPASTTLTISASTSADSGHRPGLPGNFPGATLAFALCCMGWRKRRSLQHLLAVIAISLLGVTVLIGCGGSSKPKPVTANVSVVATSGSIQQTVPITVTIQ